MGEWQADEGVSMSGARRKINVPPGADSVTSTIFQDIDKNFFDLWFRGGSIACHTDLSCVLTDDQFSLRITGVSQSTYPASVDASALVIRADGAAGALQSNLQLVPADLTAGFGSNASQHVLQWSSSGVGVAVDMCYDFLTDFFDTLGPSADDDWFAHSPEISVGGGGTNGIAYLARFHEAGGSDTYDSGLRGTALYSINGNIEVHWRTANNNFANLGTRRALLLLNNTGGANVNASVAYLGASDHGHIVSYPNTATSAQLAFAVRNRTAGTTLASIAADGTITASGLSITNLTLPGDLTVNGNTTIGNASSDTLTVNATPTFVTDVNLGNGTTDKVNIAGYIENDAWFFSQVSNIFAPTTGFALFHTASATDGAAFHLWDKATPTGSREILKVTTNTTPNYGIKLYDDGELQMSCKGLYFEGDVYISLSTLSYTDYCYFEDAYIEIIGSGQMWIVSNEVHVNANTSLQIGTSMPTIGFWGATPVSQRTDPSAASTTHATASFGDVNTALNALGTIINDLRQVLLDLGITA